jgi:CheY-like chemotaxis protein
LRDQFTVRLAHGGLEGLAALQQHRPTALILDLFMPQMDGFALLENIQSDETLRNLPVIIFTAGDLNEEQQQKLSDFSLEMMHKSSFNEQDMLAALQSALKMFSNHTDEYNANIV